MILALIVAAVLSPQPEPLDRGRLAFQAGDLNRAEQLFREFLKQHPQSAEAYSNLAAVHARREQYAEAVKLYERALQINPKLVPVHFNIAVPLGQLRRHREAATHLRAFLKSYPDEPRARQLLGLCLVETGELTAALRELEASFRTNPNDGSIRYALAYAHARAGDVERAAAIFRDADSNPAQSKLIQGLIEYRQQRYAEAKVSLREAVAAMPSAAPAIAALVRLELNDRNDGEAIALLERAVRLNPSDAESTYQLGVLYGRNGRAVEAVSALRRSLTLRANYPDPHYHLGRLAFEQKDYETALAELEQARRILPDQEAIHFLLGRVYQAMGRADKAKAPFAEVR
ncbi:MAG: tetratricopeptide repeat protein, partial [Acidobacteria bacterium]|nr:tetratricopeptide repeat protein [Acidobacteriota bacterium]